MKREEVMEGEQEEEEEEEEEMNNKGLLHTTVAAHPGVLWKLASRTWNENQNICSNLGSIRHVSFIIINIIVVFK